MIRTFIAVPMPRSIQDALLDLVIGMPGARWVRPEDLHLTLRFIGDLSETRFDELEAALTQVNIESFPLELKGVGVFPPRGQPKQLWIGIVPNEALFALRRSLDRVLRDFNLALDGRKYIPHITIARVGDAPLNQIQAFVVKNDGLHLEPVLIEHFGLYRSAFAAVGVHYSIDARFGPMGPLSPDDPGYGDGAACVEADEALDPTGEDAAYRAWAEGTAE